jgi:hypothetical protein
MRIEDALVSVTSLWPRDLGSVHLLPPPLLHHWFLLAPEALNREIFQKCSANG